MECALAFLDSAVVLFPANRDRWSESLPHAHYRYFDRGIQCIEANRVKLHQNAPDFQGKTVEVVTFHRPLSTIIHRNESEPDKRYDGMEMNIFKEIANQLNFSWKVNELENDVDKWGQLNNGSWKGGIMEALTSGTAEVGFSTLWVSPMQSPYLEYTTSWSSISSTFLVPKPVLIGTSWKSLFRPFSSAVWMVVVLVLVLFPLTAGLAVTLHERLKGSSKSPAGDILVRYSLYTIGSLTGGSGQIAAHQESPLRPLVSWWYVFVLLLCNSYTSNIVAYITLPSFTPKINTVHQLVDLHFSWGRTYAEDNLSKHLDFEKFWHRKFAENFIVYNESDQRKLLLTQKFALSTQKIDGSDYLFVELPVDDDLAEALRVMRERIRTYRCAIALRKHSPLLHGFNTVLQRMMESGILQHFQRDAVRRFQNPAYKRISLETSSGFQSLTSLTLDNYKFMFYSLLLGWGLSLFCFLLELRFGRGRMR